MSLASPSEAFVQTFTEPENTLEKAQSWIRQHPESHKPYTLAREGGVDVWRDMDGKPVERDVHRERLQIKAYMDRIHFKDPEHYKLLRHLETQMPPMDSRNRVSVNIPAWMEGNNLYKLLENYTRQTDHEGKPLEPSLYEINIIVNRKSGEAPDNSIEEINRFIVDAKAQGKVFNINFIDIAFDAPYNNVGNARRVINDLTLLRSLRRAEQQDPLYIESEDADLLTVDPHTIINLIHKFDLNPHLDTALGVQDRFPPLLMKNDYLFIYRRLSDFRKRILQRERYDIQHNENANFVWNRVFTGGWNTGITAEAYALIGGYDPLMAWGEDLMVGIRLSMARGNGVYPNTKILGRVRTRIDSSPRRYIYNIASDSASYGPNFFDPELNATIKNSTPEELLEHISHLARIDNDNIHAFQSLLNYHFKFIRKHTPSREDALRDMKLILVMLGFKSGDCQFTDEAEIQIVNYQNLKNKLEQYRQRHQESKQGI